MTFAVAFLAFAVFRLWYWLARLHDRMHRFAHVIGELHAKICAQRLELEVMWIKLDATATAEPWQPPCHPGDEWRCGERPDGSRCDEE